MQNSSNLYPLRFRPRFVPKMWGGRTLAAVLGKELPPNVAIGESWELFDFPPGAVGVDARQPGDDPLGWTSSEVADGALAGRRLHDLVLSRADELLGAVKPVSTPAGPQFPLLVKFLDARTDLSVQVHPTPEYAARHAGAFVKNEAWHVLAHEPGARLLLGTNPGVTADRFRSALAEGVVEPLIAAEAVETGRTYYLPSGTLHALGGGILVAEVQTPSDTTFRVFDFNRIDPSTGRLRSLHVVEAMQCISFDGSVTATRTEAVSGTVELARAPEWVLVQIEPDAGAGARSAASRGGFVLGDGLAAVAIVVKGRAMLSQGGISVAAKLGQTFLLPAAGRTRIEPGPMSRVLLTAFPPFSIEDLGRE